MKLRILVVDDNVTNLKLVADLLEMEGCIVSTAGDAEEVIQLLLEPPLPDLILMDIALPGMDGLTLTRQLKAQNRYRGIPIVVLTASAMKGDDQRVFEAGCDGYVTKPIDTRTFGQTVRDYFKADVTPETKGQP